MPKTSDWVIVATEGSTVDGRKITKSWINDMAALYSKDEYTALIWPEHYRSSWAPFEGKNWGVVEELKAEEKDGKLRLFAKITPNQYLIDANKDGQKLFTSIEPNPDYKGEGRCYLEGLAVTDSPASTGTTQLKFSRGNGKEISFEAGALEEIDLSECFSLSDKFFSYCKAFFTGGEQPPHTTDSKPEDEEPMNQEQFSQMMGAINALGTKQGELEEQFKNFSTKQAPETGGEQTPPSQPSGGQETGVTAEQFSQLTEQLKGIATKQSELATQFNQLKQQGPEGQGPAETGGTNTVEAL